MKPRRVSGPEAFQTLRERVDEAERLGVEFLEEDYTRIVLLLELYTKVKYGLRSPRRATGAGSVTGL